MTKTEMPKAYDPKKHEAGIYRIWEESGAFHAAPNPDRKPFTIMIPPPNVTGILHMGHVLDNALQDSMIRFRRMQGREALWQPGTDHAGIATQNVVEKALREEGIPGPHRLCRLKEERAVGAHFVVICYDIRQPFMIDRHSGP